MEKPREAIFQFGRAEDIPASLARRWMTGQGVSAAVTKWKRKCAAHMETPSGAKRTAMPQRCSRQRVAVEPLFMANQAQAEARRNGSKRTNAKKTRPLAGPSFFSISRAGAVIPAALANAAKVSTRTRAARSGRRE